MRNDTYKGRRLFTIQDILKALHGNILDLHIEGHVYAAEVGYATSSSLAVIACPHPGVREDGLTTVQVALCEGVVTETLSVEGGVNALDTDTVRWRPPVLFVEGAPSRIPEYSESKHLVSWVLGMRRQGLVFHPDDDLRLLEQYEFTVREMLEIERALSLLKKDWGDDFYNLLHVLGGGPDGPEVSSSR